MLDNDGDVEGDPFAVTAITGCADATAPFDCTLADGAVVHVEANGEFSYTPGPGDAVGSFTYTVTDTPVVGVAASVNGTVTFTFFDMIWYVDADAAAGGNGTSGCRSTRSPRPRSAARTARATWTMPTTTSSCTARPRRSMPASSSRPAST